MGLANHDTRMSGWDVNKVPPPHYILAYPGHLAIPALAVGGETKAFIKYTAPLYH